MESSVVWQLLDRRLSQRETSSPQGVGSHRCARGLPLQGSPRNAQKKGLILHRWTHLVIPWSFTAVQWWRPFYLGCNWLVGEPSFQVLRRTRSPGLIRVGTNLWLGIDRILLPHSVRVFCTCPKLARYLTRSWVSVSNGKSEVRKGFPYIISKGLRLRCAFGAALSLRRALSKSFTQLSDVS